MPERDQKYTNSLEKIADAIGSVTPDELGDIIDGMNQAQLLVRGSKNPEGAYKVIEQGVRPTTSEVNGSCWSGGLAAFYPFMDSTFFHWSGRSRIDRPEICELNITVLPFEKLGEYGIKDVRLLSADNRSIDAYHPNRQHVVGETVPPEAFCHITVQVEHPLDDKRGREYRQRAEHLMLYAIKDQIEKGVECGEVIKIYDKME